MEEGQIDLKDLLEYGNEKFNLNINHELLLFDPEEEENNVVLLESLVLVIILLFICVTIMFVL